MEIILRGQVLFLEFWRLADEAILRRRVNLLRSSKRLLRNGFLETPERARARLDKSAKRWQDP